MQYKFLLLSLSLLVLSAKVMAVPVPIDDSNVVPDASAEVEPDEAALPEEEAPVEKRGFRNIPAIANIQPGDLPAAGSVGIDFPIKK